jgi:hypothetical protein
MCHAVVEPKSIGDLPVGIILRQYQKMWFVGVAIHLNQFYLAEGEGLHQIAGVGDV